MSRELRLVWMDLEMSGLDPDTEHILEIATIVTEADLEIVAEGPSLVIHQPDSVLDAMDEWNTTHHGESGLTERVRTSPISLHEAEAQTLAFLKEHVEPHTAPLCGNSIGTDRRFLYRYMPRLSEFLHYRNVDVSSIKELVYRWYPRDLMAPYKESTHRALEDIKGSIEELRWYRDNIFLPPHAAG